MTPHKIFELLERDPRTEKLANSGQARIGDPRDSQAQRELRGELASFVCTGKFADAMERVLGNYLANLGASRQDSVWVSGFFGSGKSHLLKMFAHLWANTGFDDGSTARALVPSGLPPTIATHLRELDVQAQRSGAPPVHAAGTLLAGNMEHVRLSILEVVLQARGWPANYAQARFCFWLREQGLLASVRRHVEEAGKEWHRELANLYVSPLIAGALLKAYPEFAADAKAARQLLAKQFPRPASDIRTPEFVDVAKEALADDDGRLPLTILVLDEVQQYIGDSSDRSAAVTEVAEAIQTQFESRVLLVAAGQSALSAGTKSLKWLSDRFRVSVQLTDAEVEDVTREVLLRKKPSAAAPLERMFETCAGEVSRHLSGTQLAPRGEDHRRQADDYPLLRTRRRFWEQCFQAVAGGAHSQLRSQLRILHDSLGRVAERDVGAVIPASDLFEALAPDLVNSDVLLPEIATRIAKLNDDTEAGVLRRDLCGLAFLIGKLPRQGAANLGVRADARTLADLLVDDVSADSGLYRKRVQDALEDMASEGVLLKVADEYRIQTTAGAEWERAFRERRAALGQDEVQVSHYRQQLLAGAVDKVASRIRLRHGKSKTRRKLALHVDTLPEPSQGSAVRLWLRDEWSCRPSEVENDARLRGMDDPVLHVFLPKRNADELRRHVVAAEAARQVLDEKGRQSSAEGKEAATSMTSRRDSAEAALDRIVRETLAAGRVLQGGGTEVFAGNDLEGKIETAATKSLARLFPRFPEADHLSWAVAFKRARQGSDTPFQVVGWDGPLPDHPVAKEVMATIGNGKRGSEVRKTLGDPPFGWPQDAVDAALVALHGRGHLRATRNGAEARAGGLDQTAIRTTVFRPETVVLSTSQRIALRGLFQKADVSAKPGEEGSAAVLFLNALRELAEASSGEAPLPAPKGAGLLGDLGRLTGNEQLAAIHEVSDKLTDAIERWRSLGERAAARGPAWRLAGALRRHAAGLPVGDEVGAELDAVAERRSLLEAMDPVAPCTAKLAKVLREELVRLRAALAQAVADAVARLGADDSWRRLDEADRGAILLKVGLAKPRPLAVETDEAVRRELDARNLAAWRAEVEAVPAREAAALEAAAKRLAPATGGEPVAVQIRRGTLIDEAAVRAWLDEHERKLMEAVKKGTVVVK